LFRLTVIGGFALAMSATAIALKVLEERGQLQQPYTAPRLSVSRASLAENKMHAFIRRFLMHYGIYRRYPLGRFPALRNAWRAAQPCANYPAGLFGAWWLR
jgi:hypothetical protein